MTAASPPQPVRGPVATPAAPRATPVAGATSVRLPGQHFAAAVLYLVAGAIGLVWIAPELAIGAYPSPHVAGITHLFTLGWLTTTIFGALHQLLPVALGAPLRSARLGHAAFWTFAPGAGLFAAGVAISAPMLHHAGIALVAVGIVLAIGNFASSLPRASSRDATWWAIAVALAFLGSTLVLGVVLLHNLHSGFLAEARLRVLGTHLHVALVGWALIMIVGVSHRLLPMFLLSHGADTRWTARSLAPLGAGVGLLALGLNVRVAAVTWSGIALLEAGVGCFVWQALSFYRKRVRKRIDVGMRYAAAALGFLITSAALGAVVHYRGPAHPRLATAYVIVGLLGGIILYVVGFFYKIVPLLAWTVRYGARAGAGSAPTIAQTFSHRVAHAQLALMALGVTLLAAGTGAGSVHVTRCGAVLFFGAVLLFVTQIRRVAVGKAA
jgi:hypothetical protein